MENNIITQNTATPEYSEAISLHRQIIINGRLAAEHLVEMCRCIKQMRDEKLYISLGYEDFGNYCEDMLKIKARQGYSYIKIYEDLPQSFLQSNANIGVTKLELLTHVNPLDREEFIQNTNLNEITVNELKAEIDRLKIENGEKVEQLSMFEKQNTELENKVTDLTKELAEKPAEVAVREPDPGEIEKLVNKRLEESRKELDKKQKELDESRKELDKKQKEQSRELDELKARLEQSEHEKTALKQEVSDAKSASESKIETLKAKLAETKGNSDAQKAVIEHYLKMAQRDIKQLCEEIDKFEDEEKKTKYKAAIAKFLSGILESLR